MPPGNWPSDWANISLNQAATALPVLIRENGFLISETLDGSLCYDLLSGEIGNGARHKEISEW